MLFDQVELGTWFVDMCTLLACGIFNFSFLLLRIYLREL
jgi:hypothetical protein